MVEIRIRTCPARAEMAEKLRTELGLPESSVFTDERENGGSPLDLWFSMSENLPSDATHLCLLDEDTEVSAGFKDIVEQMTQAHGECAFSLFTTDLNSRYFDEFIKGLKTPYLRCTRLFGCAVILPVSIVSECFAWIRNNLDTENVHDAYGVQEYLEQKGIPILTTVPGIIQHIGDQSLYDPSLPIRRTQRFEKNPEADWANRQVSEIPSLEWFAPGAGTKTLSFEEASKILKGEK